MLDQIPCPMQHYQLEELDGESLLYSPSSTRTIYLNSTASLVWQLCNGQQSVGEIIDILQQSFPDGGDSVANDVCQCIQQLVTDQALALESA